MKKDIFISYRNDGEGNNFAARLFETLNEMEYNPNTLLSDIAKFAEISQIMSE